MLGPRTGGCAFVVFCRVNYVLAFEAPPMTPLTGGHNLVIAVLARGPNAVFGQLRTLTEPLEPSNSSYLVHYSGKCSFSRVLPCSCQSKAPLKARTPALTHFASTDIIHGTAYISSAKTTYSTLRLHICSDVRRNGTHQKARSKRYQDLFCAYVRGRLFGSSPFRSTTTVSCFPAISPGFFVSFAQNSGRANAADSLAFPSQPRRPRKQLACIRAL